MQNRIIGAQTMLLETDLEKLKELTNMKNTKDALSEAVRFYIETGGRNV